MPSSIKIYTTGNMEDAVVDSATSEATGYPKENMIDNNPDTSWKPTSAATQTIDIDLQEAKTVDYIYLFVHNYITLTTTVTCLPQYSDDDSTYYNAITSGQAIHNLTDAPHRFIEVTETSDPHRYWRFTFAINSTLPEIALMLCCQEFDVGQGNEWPENDKDKAFNRIITGGGGRIFSIGLNKNTIKVFNRNYKISGTTNFNAIRNAFLDSVGCRHPIIVQEGDTYDDAVLAYILNNEFDKGEQSYQYYNLMMQFYQLPFIDDGDSY